MGPVAPVLSNATELVPGFESHVGRTFEYTCKIYYVYQRKQLLRAPVAAWVGTLRRGSIREEFATIFPKYKLRRVRYGVEREEKSLLSSPGSMSREGEGESRSAQDNEKE